MTAALLSTWLAVVAPRTGPTTCVLAPADFPTKLAALVLKRF
jgi:hypothetical protein